MSATYNVGLTYEELTLLVRLIDDDNLSDADEEALRGIRRKLAHKRKVMRNLGRVSQ